MEPRGILLINLGTPAAPHVPEVRRYLREFLSDPRVLDVPALVRAFLLWFVILPRRPAATARAYRAIWTERGSPLLVHGQDLAAALQAAAGAECRVDLAMRYGSPSIAAAVARFRAQGIHRIEVFPLFPQYSSAAWGSAVEKLFREAARLWDIPTLAVVPPYYEHPAFIKALASIAEPLLAAFRPDFVLLSYHGLPERHVRKSDASGRHCLAALDCCGAIGRDNATCYRAHCCATSRALARRLALAPGTWEVAFQSRLLRDPWIRPYTDVRIRELARSGCRRVAVISPSFTADCLETLEEIGIRAREEFRAHGGEELMLVPSLNAEEIWVRAILEILENGARGVAPSLSAPSTDQPARRERR